MYRTSKFLQDASHLSTIDGPLPGTTYRAVEPHPDVVRRTPKMVFATSARGAMELDDKRESSSALPITVTITLTTVLWPRTAH